LGPIPNPQSPIPNPQSPININYIFINIINNLKIYYNLINDKSNKLLFK